MRRRRGLSLQVITRNCDQATKPDSRKDKLLQGCDQIYQYQGMLKDAVGAVTTKNKLAKDAEHLKDLQTVIKAENYRERMDFSNFLSP